jgi:acetyl esterase/lipase
MAIPPYRNPMKYPLLLAAALLAGLTCHGRAAEPSSSRVLRDLEYAQAGEISLKLNLHLPNTEMQRVLIVWVHGGAWRAGSKESMPLGALVAAGYPVASVDYRLSPQAKFPAQIHDIKAALRFLRGHGRAWNLPTAKIVIAGDSAGAHLASLVGVSNGHPELEGTVGNDRAESSAVQGIISFFGGSNLTTILKQSTPHGIAMRVPALDLLLGGQPDAVPALARLASPVFHVDANDPPLLLLHGDQDPQMPVNQSLELLGAYRRENLSVQFEIVHGAGHGGAAFYQAARLEIVRAFLARLP